MVGRTSTRRDGRCARRGGAGGVSTPPPPTSPSRPPLLLSAQAGSGQAPLPLSGAGTAQKRSRRQDREAPAQAGLVLTVQALRYGVSERLGKTPHRFPGGCRVWALGADRLAVQQAHTLHSKKRGRL